MFSLLRSIFGCRFGFRLGRRSDRAPRRWLAVVAAPAEHPLGTAKDHFRPPLAEAGEEGHRRVEGGRVFSRRNLDLEQIAGEGEVEDECEDRADERAEAAEASQRRPADFVIDVEAALLSRRHPRHDADECARRAHGNAHEHVARAGRVEADVAEPRHERDRRGRERDQGRGPGHHPLEVDEPRSLLARAVVVALDLRQLVERSLQGGRELATLRRPRLIDHAEQVGGSR